MATISRMGSPFGPGTISASQDSSGYGIVLVRLGPNQGGIARFGCPEKTSLCRRPIQMPHSRHEFLDQFQDPKNFFNVHPNIILENYITTIPHILICKINRQRINGIRTVLRIKLGCGQHAVRRMDGRVIGNVLPQRVQVSP